MKLKGLIVAAALAGALATGATAASATAFVEQGHVTGTLDSDTFTDRAITIYGGAVGPLVDNGFGIYDYDLYNLHFSIYLDSGVLMQGLFTDSSDAFSNTSADIVGITVGLADVIGTVGVGNYYLTPTISPFVGGAEGNPGYSFDTDLGALEIDSFDGDTKFFAVATISAVPEPGTWALMIGGIGMIGGMLRIAEARRRKDDVVKLATA